MKQVITKSGFSCEVDEMCLDDMAFLDLICDIEDGNILAYRRLIDKILSAPDKERLYDHLRTEDGRVPISAISNEVTEIVKELGAKK